MSVTSERGIQIIATETYPVEAGKLVIATSREQGKEVTHVALLPQEVSIASIVATKDERAINFPQRHMNIDIPIAIVTARAAALEAVASLNGNQSGALLASLLSQLHSNGINFTKVFQREGLWAEYRHDWKAEIGKDGKLLCSRRFHGLDNNLDEIDETTFFQFENGKLEEI